MISAVSDDPRKHLSNVCKGRKQEGRKELREHQKEKTKIDKRRKKKRYDARKEIRGDDRWGWVNKTKKEREKKKKSRENSRVRHTDVNSSFKAEILRMIRSRLLQEANLLSDTSTGLHYTVMVQ